VQAERRGRYPGDALQGPGHVQGLDAVRGQEDPACAGVTSASSEVDRRSRGLASSPSRNINQIALAWLLAVSPVTLPIPGTATSAHLEDNMAAAALQLEQDEIHAITAAASSATQRPT
jgi:aryl-alcohol dehydrogenase-like predicted oxidoreductase